MKFLKCLFAVVVIFAGLNSDYATAADDLVVGAKKEGGLVLYLSTNLTDANGLIQLFKQSSARFFSSERAEPNRNFTAESRSTQRFNLLSPLRALRVSAVNRPILFTADPRGKPCTI
jgi:hypothetical protein